ncbi:hypothetical protein BD626DRAFT_213796 [Schizophyllum amplum]|uniref:Uncharacterized protein n=1 Tax=Schizophyllum amplum TaxID=97359 RepID=A0A550BXR4_9AGAR|nr:hypothetical protein BD626DRAFT_213796 [Auriculariopsis ampla]
MYRTVLAYIAGGERSWHSLCSFFNALSFAFDLSRPSPKMFKLAILASLLVAVSAIPAADLAARARVTETITDNGCVQYVAGQGTETHTVPATTTTVHDPRTTSVTTTKSVYPPGLKVCSGAIGGQLASG